MTTENYPFSIYLPKNLFKMLEPKSFIHPEYIGRIKDLFRVQDPPKLEATNPCTKPAKKSFKYDELYAPSYDFIRSVVFKDFPHETVKIWELFVEIATKSNLHLIPYEIEIIKKMEIDPSAIMLIFFLKHFVIEEKDENNISAKKDDPFKNYVNFLFDLYVRNKTHTQIVHMNTITTIEDHSWRDAEHNMVTRTKIHVLPTSLQFPGKLFYNEKSIKIEKLPEAVKESLIGETTAKLIDPSLFPPVKITGIEDDEVVISGSTDKFCWVRLDSTDPLFEPRPIAEIVEKYRLANIWTHSRDQMPILSG